MNIFIPFTLYLQIINSTIVMYFSIILMMAQKDALNQLMNLGALWALNNFDNFCYFVFEMAIAKNIEHRSIIHED